MFSEANTEELIKERMLNNVGSDLDKREGSFIFDSVSPAAIELALAYIQLDTVLNIGFAQTTYGQYLDYRAEEHGLTRKTAVKSTGLVIFTGAQGAVIALGSLLATPSGVQYATTSTATLDSSGKATVGIEAVVAGSAGNVPPGTITAIPISIQGVASVTNLDPTTGGVDTESDADLLAQLLENLKQPAASGNAADYLQWSKSIAGIADSRVFERWNGPWSVKVVLLSSNKSAPSQAKIDEVAAYIETVRPVCVEVTVTGATEVSIDIAVKLTLKAGGISDNARTQMAENITNYFKSIAFNDLIVRYSKIAEAILDAEDVLDYENLTVNNGTGNVQLTEEQVAVLGLITLI